MTTLNVRDHGAKGDGVTDDTAAIQAAIELAKVGDTVVVPSGRFMIDALYGGDNFLAGGLELKSLMTLKLEFGAVLQAIPNPSTHYTIITVKNCTGTKITGPGTIMGDRDTRPAAQFGWGFGIVVWGSNDVTIENLTIAKLFGDGITVNDGNKLLVDHVVFDSCRRQNMSVGSGDGITITNCTFKNAAMSGLDLELDLDTWVLSNVVVKYCSFTGSGGPAHIGVGSPVGKYKNITISNCQFDLKMQPIFAHDRAGSTGIPWWAFLLNRIFYEGLHAPTYRFVGYPTKWTTADAAGGA